VANEYVLQITIDPDDYHAREEAHAAVDALFDSVSFRRPKVGRRYNPNLLKLDARALADLIRGFDTPLNDGERAMLRAIAEVAPEPRPFTELKEILGSAQKFGNVSSGLTRRFVNRGYSIPFETKWPGYRFSEADAKAVLALLDES